MSSRPTFGCNVIGLLVLEAVDVICLMVVFNAEVGDIMLFLFSTELVPKV